ncbi:MAG: hypothetical protein OHM56_06905 [Spiroplasma phoeniceum]|nr:MAG: hypothetical protein OHM56_06905 [Spiroplasma phoeniceum]
MIDILKKLLMCSDQKIMITKLLWTIYLLQLIKLNKQKKDLSNIIIHSDYGFQYTSKIYNKCIPNEIIISMGKNYHCADNILIGSFHSLLKKRQFIAIFIFLMMNILMMLKNEINDIQVAKKKI